jgi:hypothetical protein
MNHLHLRRLKLNTCVLLHPEFVKASAQFALSHGVALVGEVFPSTSFKKDPDTNEKTAKVNANIHLVQHGAIRLFTERVGDDDWIRNIEVNPALLLYGEEDHLLTEQDLVVALSMLRDKVAPLLADPLDACHIVPGLVDDAHVAYLCAIKSEVLLPDIVLRCLHNVSHPDTGAAEGTTKKRIKLGDRGDCVICFETAKWEVAGPRGTQEVQGVRVSLRLKGHALLARYGLHGATAMVGDTRRLVAFRAPDVARVYQEVMSQLEGTYLPVPVEWAVAGKAKTKKGKTGNPTTPAKVMALLSVLTPIPLDELRAMDEGLRQTSRATRTRLNKAVEAAVACLKRVPVSSLFGAEVYATPVPGTTPPVDVRIDARITAAYGSGVSAANP